MSDAKRIYFVAGERSGDAHGADVMQSLRKLAPATQFAGVGGPHMREIGGTNVLDWVEEAGVLGLWEVLKKYRWFKAQFNLRLAEIAEFKPDAVVFIDYPGFNLRLAKAIRKAFPDLRLIYYISPQVWAWNRGRIPKMAKLLDQMLCIFPFEKRMYEASGLATEFVGHPLVDQLEEHRVKEPREGHLVGLFPGSRYREIRKHFPVLLRTAELIHIGRPDVRFEIAAASEKLAGHMRRGLHDAAPPDLPIQVTVGKSRELMQRAAAGIVASGTATVEAAYYRLPFVIIYKVNWLTWQVGRALVNIPFLGMVNILAGKLIVPEFLQSGAQPEPLSDAVLRLLNHRLVREEQVTELAKVAAMLGETGASERAAEAIAKGVGIEG